MQGGDTLDQLQRCEVQLVCFCAARVSMLVRARLAALLGAAVHQSAARFEDSADRARRMAEAFGLKVPGVAPKPAKARGGAAATLRARKA